MSKRYKLRRRAQRNFWIKWANTAPTEEEIASVRVAAMRLLEHDAVTRALRMHPLYKKVLNARYQHQQGCGDIS